jgi:Domain of unknown function (DUF4260)
MKSIIKLEELAMLLVSVFVLAHFDVAWWWYLLMFIGPDISMLGYFAGKTAGAFTYNFFHHKAVGLAVVMAGYAWNIHELLWTGIVIFGHSSFDRMMGYGLKYTEGFQFTHLGKVGKEK